jgi:hypothetical protein
MVPCPLGIALRLVSHQPSAVWGTCLPKSEGLTAVQQALEEASVEFTNGSEPGVKLKRNPE